VRAATAVVLLCAAAGLGGCTRAEPSAEVKAEIARREAFARAIVIDAGAEPSLHVASRSEIHFEEGFGAVEYDPPDDWHNHAFRWMGQNGHVRLRSHGARAMRLKIGGWVNEKVTIAKPVLSLTIDGRYVAWMGPVEQGLFGLDVVIPATELAHHGWIDLHVLVSAVGFHWVDAPDLKAIVIFDLQWDEA
jgi:hypothetical protein